MTNGFKVVGASFLLIAAVFSYSCKVTKTVDQSEKVPPVEINTQSKLNADQQKEFQYFYIEGIKQRTIGNIDEAIKIFSHCLELDPSSSSSMFEIANIHISKGDFQSSMMLLEKAVTLNPENQYYHILLAKVYQQNKLFEKAANEYATLVKLDPNKQEYPFYQATMLGMAGKYDEAIVLYNHLEQQLGVMESIAIGKQQLYLQQKNKAAAYKEIENLISAFPSESRYYGLLADMYLADGNRDKAFEYYNKILQIDPDEGFVHLSIANYYKEGGDIAKAYDHIKIAFGKAALDFETKVQMFVLLTQPGATKISDAQELELINILIETHVDDERPRVLYSDYFYEKKQFKEAREQLRLALDMNKDNYTYWEKLLLIDNDLLDWKTLSTDSKKAVNYFPQQPLIYILDAVSLLQLEKYDEMFAVLDSGQVYAESNPKMLSQFYLYRAEAYYKQKKVDEAFKMYEKVIEKDPQNYMAMNNYAYYLSLKGLKLELAEKMSGSVIQNNPDNATYLDTYAWVLFKKKDYNLAKFYIESAISNDKDSSAVLIEHYGDILFYLDEKEKAVDQWKKSLKMGNKSKVLPEKINKIIFIESSEEQ
jgi:tetratricopeptide (TPR) repeat protein